MRFGRWIAPPGAILKAKHNNASATTKGKAAAPPDHQFVILTALRGGRAA
jgi:hypothetical protein